MVNGFCSKLVFIPSRLDCGTNVKQFSKVRDILFLEPPPPTEHKWANLLEFYNFSKNGKKYLNKN